MPGATVWEKTKSGSKKGFDKVYAVVDKLGPPVNRLSNKLGAEAFWPASLDKESDKAARILKSFCKDGFYHEEEKATAEGPKAKQRVLKKIPSQVIANAKGLAIFTVMRTGLWVSGAGGSGILIARLPDGSWSGPSGIMLHTAGLGFLVGVDIYDCVVVINTQEALDAFSKVRCTLGGEVSAVAGPLGMGGVLETEVHKRQAPIFTYLKSRGFYAGVQIDGTIVIERTDENEAFYGERISVGKILQGKPLHVPQSTKVLMATISSAQGEKDVDSSLIPTEAAPGDFDLENDGPTFGVPDSEDPDPYGVLALESAGMEIREAGSRSRPTSEQFEYKPSPTSPTFSVFHRRSMRSISSMDGITRKSTDQGSRTEDRGVQTDDLPDPPPRAIRSPRRKESLAESQLEDIKEVAVNGHEPHPLQTPSDPISLQTTNESRTDAESIYSVETSENGYFSGEDTYGEDVEIHDGAENAPVTEEATMVQSPTRATFKVKMVAIPKRVPPKLPVRNPNRSRPRIRTNASGVSANGSTQTQPHKSEAETKIEVSADTKPKLELPLKAESKADVKPLEAETKPEIVKEAQAQIPQEDEWKEVALETGSQSPPLRYASGENPWTASYLLADDANGKNGLHTPPLTSEDLAFVKQEEAFYSIPSSPAGNPPVQSPIRAEMV